MNKSGDQDFLSTNQLYRNSIECANGVHFKDWIDSLKKQYSTEKPRLDFVSWANKYEANKIKKQANADAAEYEQAESKAKEKNKVKNTIIEVGQAVKETSEGLKAQEQRRDEAMKEKTIFGMKPIVFYSVGVAIALAVTAGVFFYMKHKNKQNS